jgi:hypothetical protein
MNSPFAPETKLTSEDPAKKWLVRWRKLGNACEGSAASSRQFRAKCGVIITQLRIFRQVLDRGLFWWRNRMRELWPVRSVVANLTRRRMPEVRILVCLRFTNIHFIWSFCETAQLRLLLPGCLRWDVVFRGFCGGLPINTGIGTTLYVTQMPFLKMPSSCSSANATRSLATESELWNFFCRRF